MAYRVKIATCNLNQWSLDFEGNKGRIRESIIQAKKQGARFRTGPELEVTGYGCEDHFAEYDTVLHAWEIIAELMKDEHLTMDILCDIGLPVIHRNILYNCRVFILNRRILGVRPKIFLASDGNYREQRWFTPWSIGTTDFGPLQEFRVPLVIMNAFPDHARTVPFGIMAFQLNDTVIASETCEEMFVPNNPSIAFGLDGVEIIANGSGSHHELRKLSARIDLIRSATTKGGGVYLYANQKGCDGGRLFFDGTCMVWINGNLVAQGSQFNLQDVEVVTAVVNLQDVRSQRSNFKSRSTQASNAPKIHRIAVDFTLGPSNDPEDKKRPPFIHSPMEEIALGPSAWLWDYLRRSGMRGYFLPLSGGADSASTVTLVGIMCRRVFDAIQDPIVLNDLRRILKDQNYEPKSAEEICGKLMFSCYMASQYSGQATRGRAAQLAEALGVTHSSIFIDEITDAVQNAFKNLVLETNKNLEPLKRDAKMVGGTMSENLALQNIQARSRMVMSYFLSQLLPWSVDKENNPWPGSLLVLGSANVDEALRGYYTKYDCSAADINPIGGIRKSDLYDFLAYSAKFYDLPILNSVVEATPSAELSGEEGVQSDEVDMGMSYAELADLGYIRKVDHSGPLRTFEKVRTKWADEQHQITPSRRKDPQPVGQVQQTAQKVKDFYFYHNVNRHKMTTLTPSYHAENYGPEDNRFDLRPFLYPPLTHQFAAIDKRVNELATGSGGGAKLTPPEKFL